MVRRKSRLLTVNEFCKSYEKLSCDLKLLKTFSYIWVLTEGKKDVMVW